jgi:hypothetical protein
MYAHGCAPPDDKAAVAAYRRAADEGYPEAQLELSELLRLGRGVDQPDPHSAYFWARIAERRLQAGTLKTRATECVKKAAALLSPEEIAGEEAVVDSMIAASKPTG